MSDGRMAFWAEPPRVLRPLARGSTADVVLAEVADGRGGVTRVVLKWLATHLLEDATARERLEHEGRILAALDHPNVVGYHGAGRLAGRPFLALELIRGTNLADWLALAEQGARLPLPALASVIGDVAAGLAHAHEAAASEGPLGVVHRDVCPRNLVAGGEDARARVLDFGLARSRYSSSTVAGALIGTPAYCAPEVASGEPYDRRADVFSLGVVLYELAVGRRLFRRDGAAATLVAVAEARIPPPRSIRDDLPRAFDALVMSALERDPLRRCPSARALADGLDAWHDGGRTAVTRVAAAATRSRSGGA